MITPFHLYSTVFPYINAYVVLSKADMPLPMPFSPPEHRFFTHFFL